MIFLQDSMTLIFYQFLMFFPLQASFLRGIDLPQRCVRVRCQSQDPASGRQLDNPINGNTGKMWENHGKIRLMMD